MRIHTSFITSLMALGVLSACQTANMSTPAQSEIFTQSEIFAKAWNSGVNTDKPTLQVQQIDTNTLAIRQSLRTSFEAPFMYLIFGEKKVLLIDTGVEGIDLRTEIDAQIDSWLVRTGRAKTERNNVSLVVMHTHGHGDHVGGDSGFADRPNTVIIGHKPEAVADFFDLDDWPEQTASFDLGNREVELLPTPGHHASHVMVFDKKTGILFSGDTIYPGRLYFQCGKTQEFTSSIDRVAAFANTRDVSWVLGAHIEMKAQAGKSFNTQGPSRTGEHLLELPASIIAKIQDGLHAMQGKPKVTQFDEFALFPHPADPTGMTPPNWCNVESPQ